MISEKSQSIMKLINLLNCYNVWGGNMNNDNVKYVQGYDEDTDDFRDDEIVKTYKVYDDRVEVQLITAKTVQDFNKYMNDFLSDCLRYDVKIHMQPINHDYIYPYSALIELRGYEAYQTDEKIKVEKW